VPLKILKINLQTYRDEELLFLDLRKAVSGPRVPVNDNWYSIGVFTQYPTGLRASLVEFGIMSHQKRITKNCECEAGKRSQIREICSCI
jgi:hypothetical protein